MLMIYKELENDQTIKDWLNSTSQKKGTRNLYIFAMQYYTEFLSMTPDEILDEAEQEVIDRVSPRKSRMKRHLLDYKDHLQKQGFAPLTIKSRLTGVYSFYKKNDITLPSMPRNESRAQPLKQHKDIPTKEDIQTILKHADELERAIVLIGVSGGLAANELCNLTVGDFTKGYDPVTEVTTLKLRREKEDYDFVTFLTPETSRAILDYMQSREQIPKTGNMRRLRQLSKQKIYSDSNYLLCCRKVPDEYLNTNNEKFRQLNGQAIIEIYRRLAEAAQKTTPLGTWSLIRSHNIRKYFNSTLLNNGADSFIVNFWMGHTLDDTQSAYFRASAEGGLKETYMKFVPYLTIQKEADISESPEYLRIKQENQILAAETARHVVERSELQELKAEIEKMKDTESIKGDYMQFADFEEIREMKNSLKQELEEISKLKEMLIKVGK